MTTTPSAVGQPLSSGAAIRLVAGREITTRIRSKAFIITTAVFVLVVVAGGLLLGLVQGSISATSIGLTSDTASLAPAIEAVAAANGTDIEISDVADQAKAETQVRDGDLDVLVTGTPESFGVTVQTKLDPAVQSVLAGVAQQTALTSQISTLGGDPVAVTEAITNSAPKVTALDPQQERDASQIVAGLVSGILIFISVMTCGQMVAQGVVEEKSSRVVELLLAALKPWQLMAGKVLGIGLVGLTQVTLVVAAAAGTAAARGLVDTGSVNLGATALWALVWFVVGFTMYALVLAALAALVSRQEDVGSVIAPVTMMMMIPYFIGVTVAPNDPSNSLVVGLSYVPFFSPLLMPIRIALGTASTWEAMGVLALNLAVIPLLVWIGGRIYSGAVLRTGARVKISEAFRAA